MVTNLLKAVVQKHGSLHIQVAVDGLIRVAGQNEKFAKSFELDDALIRLLSQDSK